MEANARPRSHLRTLYRMVPIGLVMAFGLFLLVDIGFCVIGTLNPDFPIRPWLTTHSRSEKSLTTDLTLVECSRTEFFPFIGMAENGRRWMIPGFMYSTSVDDQWVERAGVRIYEPQADESGVIWRSRGYESSPDGKFLLAVNQMHSEPFEILNLQTQAKATVSDVEIQGHYYTYPFTFLRWSDDSKSFTAEVTGTYVKNPGMGNAEFLAYREVWSFDPNTGNGARLSRQEQPWEKELKWE